MGCIPSTHAAERALPDMRPSSPKPAFLRVPTAGVPATTQRTTQSERGMEGGDWRYMHKKGEPEQALGAGGEATVPSGGKAAAPPAAASDVSMLLKSMEMELVLAESFPRKTLEEFLAQQRSEVEANVDNAKKAIVDTIMGVIEKAKAVKKREAAGGNKFSTMLKGGTVETFLGGVTGLVGEPHPEMERGMAEEHLDKPDSHTAFTASNYPTTSTPAIEFAVVVTAMNITKGQAHKILEEKLEAWKELKSDGWLARATAGGFEKKTGFPKKMVQDHGQTCEKTVVTQTVCSRQRGGQVPEDLRVLRPIQDYGEFREDGRLVSFEACDTDTPLQNKVKKAKLTRMEIIAIVLYSGSCFMLYNGLLRGFGYCGEVPPDVEFASAEFWERLKEVYVERRMEKAGHKFASTLHVLASAVKKLQLIAEDGQGTRLYRGLGGLDVHEFLESQGFAERAFMSSTRSLDVALAYSGIKEGKAATVLAFDISTVDNGADISEFSQFPSERETVFNTCSFLEYVRGMDTIHVTEWGVVRQLLVKINANTKALTVEELQGRRQSVVVTSLEVIHADVCRALDARVQTDSFRNRLAQDKHGNYKNQFIRSIKEESGRRVKVYKDKDAAWFASNSRLGKAFSDGLAISMLAKAKLDLWLRDASLSTVDMALSYDFQRAHAKLLARQREEVKEAEEAAALEGSDGAAAQRLEELALEECVARRWVGGEDEGELEHADESTTATPLWTQVLLGDLAAVERLLQARADPDAVPTGDKEGKTALLCALQEGHTDIASLLLKYQADANAQNKRKRTPLHWAARSGNGKIVETLVEAKADVCAQDEFQSTPLHWAAEGGHGMVVETLVEAKADVCAQDERKHTPLDVAVENEKMEAAAVLRAHGALHSLQFAAQKGMTDEVAACIAAGQDVNARGLVMRGARKHTPLDVAVENEKEEAAAVLRAHGALHSLHFAAEKGMTDEVAACIAAGQDVNARDAPKRTPLHWAAEGGHGMVVETLVEAKADVCAQDEVSVLKETRLDADRGVR